MNEPSLNVQFRALRALNGSPRDRLAVFSLLSTDICRIATGAADALRHSGVNGRDHEDFYRIAKGLRERLDLAEETLRLVERGKG